MTNYNTTKIRIVHKDGFMQVKPWASNLNDAQHLADAKKAYSLAIKAGAKIYLFK